jgi:glycosyltransferase involved in cell wall biosynthesis
MKIIIINNLYAPWVRGGADRVAQKLAEGLEKQDNEVFIISTAPAESRTERNYYLPSIFYNLEKYPLVSRFFWHLWDIVNFVNAGKIKKILREKNPDLVITHNLQGIGYLLPALLRHLKIRHFHTLHDIQLLHPSGLMFWQKEKILTTFHARIYQTIMRWLMGSPAMVISPSHWLLEEHLKRGFFRKSETKVLPNYFQVFSPRLQIATTAHEKFTFLYVGQIEAHKGIRFLIEVFLNFKKNNPTELIIAGSGSGLEELKKIVASHPEIKVLGGKSETEVEELMLAADCLVVPSLCYENSPTVIYEAIAANLPVIGAKLGGITELIDSAGGILFEPGNAGDLAEKMTGVIDNPAELDEIRSKQKSWVSPDYISELVKLAKG